MNAEGKTVALIVAGGSGSRSGEAIPKQYRWLAGKSVLGHAIDHLRHHRVDEVQVVIGPGQEALYRQAIGDRPLPAPVTGSAARQDSARNGLEALAARGGAAAVMIHDAARPFTPRPVIDRLLDALDEADGAVPVLPVADSLAAANGLLGNTVSREGLFRVQTPQTFRFEAILRAHRAWAGTTNATDDAQVLRAAGGNVLAVVGDADLDKLTYPEDFARAEQRLNSAMIVSTGMGFDVHAFEPGDHVQLGGVRLPHQRGLKGHSDADVVLHALCDALLGAVGEGDIGDHFPPSDPRWRNTDSALFVEHARSLVAARGGQITHVDVTIICEAPRIGPHRNAMRDRIANLLRLPTTKISIKATTTEGLGFTGRAEGIAAQAIATVRRPEDQ